MNIWLADYHHMLLLRLLSLAVVFGVLWPGLWLLVALGWRSASRFAGQTSSGARIWHGRTQ